MRGYYFNEFVKRKMYIIAAICSIMLTFCSAFSYAFERYYLFIGLFSLALIALLIFLEMSCRRYDFSLLPVSTESLIEKYRKSNSTFYHKNDSARRGRELCRVLLKNSQEYIYIYSGCLHKFFYSEKLSSGESLVDILEEKLKEGVKIEVLLDDKPQCEGPTISGTHIGKIRYYVQKDKDKDMSSGHFIVSNFGYRVEHSDLDKAHRTLGTFAFNARQEETAVYVEKFSEMKNNWVIA